MKTCFDVYLKKETYNIIDNNCESFAVYCKTGMKGSSQVIKAALAGILYAFVSFVSSVRSKDKFTMKE
jgi:hypothetical protein